MGIDDHTIFSTRVVKAGEPIPWNISKNYNTKNLNDSLKKKIESYQSVSYLIIQNNSIQYEAYWDGYSDTSLSNAFSATKCIISLLVGCALDEGKIKSIDQKISELENYIKGKLPY